MKVICRSILKVYVDCPEGAFLLSAQMRVLDKFLEVGPSLIL
jgi:hypothetical protein